MASHVSPPLPSPLAPSLLLLCLLVIFVFGCLLFVPFTSDDAYITMRYARNAADGLGLVFNPGERVEGYSNPLWLGLLIVAAKVGVDLVVAAKALGILAGLVTVLLALGTMQRVSGRRDWLCRIGVVPLVTSAALIVYATSGLETVLYACLLTGIVYCWLLEGPSGWWGVAACALGAALTRPEGAGVLAAVVVARFIAPCDRAEDGRDQSRHYLPLALALAILAGFLVWRHAYFGQWLPNTFYAKPPGAFGTMSLLSPLAYIGEWLQDGGVWLWVALVVTGTAGFLARGEREPEARGPSHGTVIGLLIVLVQVSLVVHAREDWMALHRFLTPVTPLLVGLGWGALLRLALPRALPVILVTLIGLLNVGQVGEAHGHFQRGEYPYNVMAGQPQEAAGRWLRAHFPPETLLACKRIGGVSYFSGMRMVDTLGLVDRRIAMIRHASAARGEPENERIAAEVFSRQPDVILLAVMKRWDSVPLDQPAPDMASNLRDVDETLHRGLAARGYQFVYRLPQGGEGELAVYARAGRVR